MNSLKSIVSPFQNLTRTVGFCVKLYSICSISFLFFLLTTLFPLNFLSDSKFFFFSSFGQSTNAMKTVTWLTEFSFIFFTTYLFRIRSRMLILLMKFCGREKYRTGIYFLNYELKKSYQAYASFNVDSILIYI